MATQQPMKAPTKTPKPEEIQYPCWASFKIDGLRGVVTKDGLMSNSMKPLPNKHCQDQFAQDSFYGFDGEIVVGAPNDPNTFKRSMSGVMTIGGEPDVYFYVFDINTDDTQKLPFEKRYEMLKTWFDTLNMEGISNVFLVPQKLVKDADELKAFEDEAIGMGFEGIMLRKGKSPYKYGRSTMKQAYLLKIKRFVDAEAMIIGFEEEMTNNNEPTINEMGMQTRAHSQENKVGAGRLGSLVVKDVISKKVFNIGSGFDHALKEEIWNNQENYMYQLATYKHFPIGDYDVPRIPIYKGLRDIMDLSADYHEHIIFYKHDESNALGFCLTQQEYDELAAGETIKQVEFEEFSKLAKLWGCL